MLSPSFSIGCCYHADTEPWKVSRQATHLQLQHGSKGKSPPLRKRSLFSYCLPSDCQDGVLIHRGWFVRSRTRTVAANPSDTDNRRRRSIPLRYLRLLTAGKTLNTWMCRSSGSAGYSPNPTAKNPRDMQDAFWRTQRRPKASPFCDDPSGWCC